MKVSTEYRNIQIYWKFYIDQAGITDYKIWSEILKFLLQLSNNWAIIIQLGWDTESLLEAKARVNFNEGNSFLIIRNFLKLHNFIVVIDGLFIEGKRKYVDNMFMWISDIEYSCYLCIHVLFVSLFSCKDFIYNVDLEMLLLLDFRITLEKDLLNLWMLLFDLFSFFCCILQSIFNSNTADNPSIYFLGNLLLFQIYQKFLPLKIIFKAACYLIKRKWFLCINTPNIFQGKQLIVFIQ